MNDKEIGEIRRHLRRDRSNITAIYGCYVNDNKYQPYAEDHGQGAAGARAVPEPAEPCQ